MAVVVGNVSHPKLQGYRLRQYYISSIADADTVVTGTPNIREIAVRTGTGSASTPYPASGSAADGPTFVGMAGYTGTLAATRRVSAHLTDASNGTITLYAPSGGSSCILMVWADA